MEVYILAKTFLSLHVSQLALIVFAAKHVDWDTVLISFCVLFLKESVSAPGDGGTKRNRIQETVAEEPCSLDLRSAVSSF